MDLKKPVLLISDLQIPFEHKKALAFCTYLKKHYKIPNENVINMGDETDGYNASDYPKDPDAEHSAVNELAITRERLRQWVEVFPQKKVCVSNHGLRWIRKATGAQIPSQIIRSYHEIFGLPESWEYREEWVFSQFKHPFRCIHGMGYSGRNGAMNAALDAQISTAIGHLSSFPSIDIIHKMGSRRMWSFNTGGLFDDSAIAFKYGKYMRNRSSPGAGVLLNEGSMPIWIPLE